MAEADRVAVVRLAFEAGERSIVDQSQSLEALRGRAALLFSAASVSGAFLGGLFAEREKVGADTLAWAGAAIGAMAFLAVLAMVVAIWRPVTFNVVIDPGVILSGYVDAEPPATIDETYHWLAFYRHADVQKNATVLEGLRRWFRVGLYALPVEVLALALAVAR